MVLHGALRMIPAAQMRRAVVRCPALGKFSQKGIPLSFNSGPEKFPSPFSQKISQRVHDSVSTRKFDDGSLLHDGGAPLVGGLCRNNKPTRCTAVIQTARTPDLPMAHSRAVPKRNGKAAQTVCKKIVLRLLFCFSPI